VATRSHKKAVGALQRAYGHLLTEHHDVATRLRDPHTGKVVIDVLKANQPLYRDALKHTRSVESEGQTYEIPSLELALAMKFASMISLARSDEDKYTDASDFIKMVKANSELDQVKLRGLGQLIYDSGGDEVLEKVRQVRAGEKLQL
jgi:hypothetical protein